MLLADASGRRIASTLRGAATWPYILDSSRRGFEQAQSFLYGFRRDWTTLQGALQTELQRGGWADPFFSRGEAYRMEEAARRIAAGAIQIGQFLRPDIEIRFYEQFPYASAGDRVIFPRPDLVREFLAGATNAAHIGRLAHRAMDHRPVRHSRHHKSGDTLADAAMLLAIDELRLIPVDRNGTVYLLGLSRSDLGSADVAGGGDAATPADGSDAPATAKSGGKDGGKSGGKGPAKNAAGAPAKSPAAGQPDKGPRSVLPVAPDAPTPQAQALQDAADAGVPFCEECAAAALQAAPAEPSSASAPPSSQSATAPISGPPRAPAPAPGSPAPVGAAPRRVLPSPPATPSPQAQTMQEAAANGTPFCEDCAAAAAAMSHA